MKISIRHSCVILTFALCARSTICLGDESRQVAADSKAATAPVGFEELQPGPKEHFGTPIGVWTSHAGTVSINDQHARSGGQCLWLQGGERTVATLALAKGLTTSGHLTFRAERWTKRAPFSFRIEKHTPRTGWSEIYNGDDEIRVGRAFLSSVSVPLNDDKIDQLRFTVVSPSGTGILIDDLSIRPLRQQQIVSIENVPFTLPVLVGIEANPLLHLRVKTNGSLNPLALLSLRGKLTGAENLSSLSLWTDDAPEKRRSVTLPNSPSAAMIHLPNLPLQDGINEVWLGCTLKENADIDGTVGLTLTEVQSSDGTDHPITSVPNDQRSGIAVRRAGDDQVHTFRIPGLATTTEGTLIAVYDVRRKSGRDLPGDIDIGMSRSTDGGRSWEPMRVIMDMGNDAEWRHDGVGDPAVLVDRNTGTIWVSGTWSHGNRSWIGSEPGLEPTETGQLLLTRSDDDGLTWSQPINITKQVKKPAWSFLLQGPGKGITMQDGTLVFAAQYQDPPNSKDKSKHRLPHSTILYSKDHGETWQIGSGAFDDTTEAQVVETEPGVLMLNCRYNRKSSRVVMMTSDLGKTWQTHSSSETALIEPRACMASLIRTQKPAANGTPWLLFSNPNDLARRRNITIKASADFGKTWPAAHQLLLDEGVSAGYSCMSMIDDDTIGILYEGSRAHMTFQRIPLSDVTGE